MEKVSSWTKREEKQDTPVLNPEDTWAAECLSFTAATETWAEDSAPDQPSQCHRGGPRG